MAKLLAIAMATDFQRPSVSILDFTVKSYLMGAFVTYYQPPPTSHRSSFSVPIFMYKWSQLKTSVKATGGRRLCQWEQRGNCLCSAPPPHLSITTTAPPPPHFPDRTAITNAALVQGQHTSIPRHGNHPTLSHFLPVCQNLRNLVPLSLAVRLLRWCHKPSNDKTAVTGSD